MLVSQLFAIQKLRPIGLKMTTLPEGIKTRTEKDSLGEVQVPEYALYGAQTQRALNNFKISGLVFPRSFIKALGLIKASSAQANKKLGPLEPAMANAICDAAIDVANGTYDDHFPLDVFQTGSGTSTNMNANEVIAKLASNKLGNPVHPNDHVNMSQSSNDVIPSCIHLSAALQIETTLLPALNNLADAIDIKAQALSSVVKTGRTHLMDAMPLTFGQELSGWAHQIRNNILRLESALPRLKMLCLGGTAVGTGVNAAPLFGQSCVTALSELTGMEFTITPNKFEGISSQDTALEISSHLKTLAASLMKISNDLRWMNSGPLAGLAEIQLPQLQPGSSIMPGKVNPVIPEAICMAAAQIIGNDATITVAAQSGNFQLNTMLPVIAFNLLQSIELLANSCNALATKALAGLEVNMDNINQVLAKNPILATALNNEIGYEKSAEIAKQAYSQKRPILDVAIEMSGVDEKILRRLLDPKNLV